MKNDQEFITYKFYDASGRRLTISATPSYTIGDVEPEEGDPEHLLIRIIPCSHDEQFSKSKGKNKLARYIIDQRAGVPSTVKSVISLHLKVKDNKPKFTFIKWCEENYYKMQNVIVAAEARMLLRGEEALDGKLYDLTMVPVLDGDVIPQSESIN